MTIICLTQVKSADIMIVTRKKEGVEKMKNGIAEIREVKDISTALTRENKKYVIAVANALLFSQRTENQRNPTKRRI